MEPLKDPEVVEISGKVGREKSAVTQRAFRFVGGRDAATSGKSSERSGIGVDAGFSAVSRLVDAMSSYSGLLEDPFSVQLRLMKWPLSADCGRATSRKQMNWDDIEVVGGLSLVLRPYRERERTSVGYDSQSERASW